MGLFQNKQHKKQDDESTTSVAADAAKLIDDSFREELRSYGREQYTKIIEETAERFKENLDSTIPHITADLKEHMTKQLDATISRVNAGITEQLTQRLAEHDRLVKDAQDLAVQSLNKNAQALHEKYQQLSSILQQTVSSQEVEMISVFEEQKARMNETHDEQDALLHTLHEGARASERQAGEFAEAMQKVISQQETTLNQVLSENNARIDATKEAQESALRTLTQSAIALEEQSNQLSNTLEQSVAKQKDIMTRAFEDNMAQIIEHYLLGAFGDQYDMKAQVPLIIKQMTDNKQAIVDDMKL